MSAVDEVLYDKRGPAAWITLNRPEVKNAIDIEAHERLCEIWADFRDDPDLRVAVITGAGDAFTAGADLRMHSPEWQTVGPMVGRDRPCAKCSRAAGALPARLWCVDLWRAGTVEDLVAVVASGVGVPHQCDIVAAVQRDAEYARAGHARGVENLPPKRPWSDTTGRRHC